MKSLTVVRQQIWLLVEKELRLTEGSTITILGEGLTDHSDSNEELLLS